MQTNEISSTGPADSHDPMAAEVTPLEPAPLVDASPSDTPADAGRMALLRWMTMGLRAGCCLRIDIGRCTPSPLQLLLLLTVPCALLVLVARWEVAGPAIVHPSTALYPLLGLAPLTFWVWATLTNSATPSKHPAPIAAWLALWMVALFPLSLVTTVLVSLSAHGLVPEWGAATNGLSWMPYGALWLWLMAIVTRVAAGVTDSRRVCAVLFFGAMFLQGVATWQYSIRPWGKDYSQMDESGVDGLKLTQEVFEEQQALFKKSLDSLSPRLAGRVNVFPIVFAPYSQDVFLRESDVVADVLEDRFLAHGRVVRLVNHASTTHTVPWATNRNLEAAIRAVAQRMDMVRDVLVIYLTSHGGGNFKLATSHWPLEVDELTPDLLRKMLDGAGIRNRVIAISACYSGGWIPALQSDTSLVMTASDSTHTSFGCGNKSNLTFFGRALFDEQLRKTHSFEAAFAEAVPVIKQREIEGNKTDGFSNPQISVGKDIRPLLGQLEQELGRGF
jgi:hypothetical protein